MKKEFKIILGILFSISVLTSWTWIDNNEGALISISAKSRGAMQIGYGIQLTLTNTETNKSYKTKSLNRISAHSVIENLPQGKYFVSRIEVPLGEVIYINESIELREFFGVLEFKSGQTYYLGYFQGARKIGQKSVFSLRIENQSIPKKLIKKLKNNQLNAGAIIKTYPYSKDELLIF